MAWTRYEKLLAIVMVVAGSVNILISKWTDITESIGRDGSKRHFNHPFLQGLGMFFAELTWLFAYKYITCYYKSRNIRDHNYPIAVRGSTTFNPLLFYLPAALDMIGTSLMFIGLNLTSASSFQMLRGALIIFTGLLSAAFLDRNLKCYEWLGIVIIVCSLSIVVVGDLFDDSYKTNSEIKNVITGDLIIIISQIIISAQYVYEEKFIIEKNVSPFQAIGWEGFFGFITLSVLLVPMYYIKVGNRIFNNPEGRLEDAIDAFYQLRNCPQVAIGFCGGLISLAFFNISGISVTQQLSATIRTVLDLIRTFIIWLFSILIGWQSFTPLHLIGFGVLVVGMCLYNDVLFRKFFIAAGILKDNHVQDEGIEPVPVNVAPDGRRSTQYGVGNDSSTTSYGSAENENNISPTRLRRVT